MSPVTTGVARTKRIKRPGKRIPVVEKPKRSSLPPLTTRGPRGVSLKPVKLDAPGEPPASLGLITLPEWYVYWYLMRQGLKPGVEFDFQSSLFGGRQIYGGLVVDFLLIDRFYPMGLVINVQGEFWHRFRTEQRVNDLNNKARLQNRGFEVVYVLEDDLIRELEQGGRSRTLDAALAGVQLAPDSV